MSMRGSTRRGGPSAAVRVHAFAWDRALVATLRHSTLAWDESLALVPLPEAGSLGARDRLSLVAQFAAHQALLQFAGSNDGDFDPAEWAVVRRRGSDVRLVRLSARAADPTLAPPPFSAVQQFAERVGTGLDVLTHAWARADAVYAEAFTRLAADAAADLRWVRSAASGAIVSPGPDGLRGLVEKPGRYRYEDEDVPVAIGRWATLEPRATVVLMRGASPLDRYSALAPFGPDRASPPAAVAEAIAGRTSGGLCLFVVANPSAFDESSRAVVAILSRSGLGSWVLPDEGEPLPAGREFVVAPRVEAAEALRGRLRGEELRAFTKGDIFPAYLASGEVPAERSPIPDPGEPAKSYLGALALLGIRVRREEAERFLGEFLFSGSIDDLLMPGVLETEGDDLVFASEAVRAEVARLVPVASHAAVSRVAAAHCRGVRAVLLWLDAGEPARAVEALEQTRWESAGALVHDLRSVPRSILTPAIRTAFAHALVDCGRYREASDTAPGEELVLARAERRRGDYATALARLERVEPSFEATLLRAEVLRLLDRDEEAGALLDGCRAAGGEERARLDYERGLHGCAVSLPPDHYLAERLATYRALERGEYARAERHARESNRRARCATERVDSSLDRVYAVFSSGQWDSARAAAVEALRELEETEGDRAAGGILYMLAYLAADAGQWAHAARIIERLRRFYAAHRDELRLAELDLLRAHLDFGRGRFDEAVRAARAVFENRRQHDQIREAAALILDEVDLLRGTLAAPRSDGRSGNAELTRRHRRLVERLHGGGPAREDAIRDSPDSVPRRLERFRIAVARGERDVAARIAAELDLVFEAAPSAAESELAVLRAAAIRDFPYQPQDFDPQWCFATRNRLGQWSTIGSVTREREELERVADEDRDWIVCSDRELLFVGGSSAWSASGRQAVGALFRRRAEAWRLRRLVEQEETARESRAPAIDGIVGQSSVIRAVESLVDRVATRDVAVCILGESGTGKELVARAIHRHSPRRQKPFTAVNCAALPETLIESELFGHVRGAFTGADRDRAGLLETTDGGTLFLDEVGELPLAAQAKLLRFLQEGEFRRVGDTASRSADVRVVSATNRRLESAVEEGRFREDLYYRIRGVELTLPPLRERGGDVLLLAGHFLAGEREKHRGGPAALSPDVEAIFTTYRWPGNVRELQNTIRAAHAMAGEGREIDVEHLPERLRAVVPARVRAGSYQDAVARFKRDLIERSLVEAKGNQNRAAAMLRMSRQALAYQIRELGILVRV